MCTYILYHDPDSPQPLTIASTRDERSDRRTSPPREVNWRSTAAYAQYLGGRQHLSFLAGDARTSPATRLHKYLDAGIQGPQDKETGGTFAAINKHGVVAAMNNREHGLDIGPKLARGGLVLDALTFASAEEAARALFAEIHKIQEYGIDAAGRKRRYPAFNLIIADKEGAYLIQNGAESTAHNAIDSKEYDKKTSTVGHGNYLSLERIPSKKVAMICGWGVNDPQSIRTRIYLPQFQKLVAGNTIPHPYNRKTWPVESKNWRAWIKPMQVSLDEDSEHGLYDCSIAQLPYERFEREGSSRRVEWKTISTSFFIVNKKGDKGVAHMYYSPDMPMSEMRFQAINGSKVDPKDIEVPRGSGDHASLKETDARAKTATETGLHSAAEQKRRADRAQGRGIGPGGPK